MGWLYRPKLKSGGRSAVWWCKYYVNGRPVRESTKVSGDTKTPPLEARNFLKEREGRVASGAPVLPRADRVRYEEAAEDLRRHYRTTGSRNMEEAEGRLKHLDHFFAGRRIAGIGQDDATRYAEQRQAEGASNASINRELAVLGRMLRVAYETSKLFRLPVLRKLKEAGPRQGFFEPEQFEAVRRRLPEDLQAAVTIAYTYGWRTQSEVLTLQRRQLDMRAGTLRLDPGTTKNDDGRVVYLTPEVRTLLEGQLARVEALQKRLGRIVPYLFPHLAQGRRLGTRAGQRRTDYRKAWASACRDAGLPGRLRHDCRRTAVRNMVNAGVPERVAMKVTGHKTRAVFDRYHIVSPGDLQEAARRIADARGHVPGTSGQERVDARSVTL